MANIVELIYRDYIFPYKRILLILFLFILFVIAGMYAYNWYAKSKLEKKPTDDVANANRRQKTVDILYFHTDWCPHCKKADPIIGKGGTFYNKYNGKDINDQIINIIDINCTEDDNVDVNASIQKYKVEHYPTVKMLYGDDVIDFESKISDSTLEKFVNAIVK